MSANQEKDKSTTVPTKSLSGEDTIANRGHGGIALLAACGAVVLAWALLTYAIRWGIMAGFSMMPIGLIFGLLTFAIPASLSGAYSIITGKRFRFVSEDAYLNFYQNSSKKVKALLLSMLTGSAGLAALVGWAIGLENFDIKMLAGIGFLAGMLWSYVFTIHRLATSCPEEA